MKVLSILLLLVCSGIPASAAKKYSYFRVGNANNINTSTTPGTVLMGGGTDVDAAFQWMCQKSGNGDFLVIRATGTDAYNPYIQQLCPNENSVATLIISKPGGSQRSICNFDNSKCRGAMDRGRRPVELHQFLEGNSSPD
jgi:hypothetical protein